MVDDVEWLNANEKIDELCWAFISFKLNRWNGKTHDNDDEDEDEFGSKETRFDEFRRIKSWNGFGSCSKIFSSRKKSLDGFYFLMNICCMLKKKQLTRCIRKKSRSVEWCWPCWNNIFATILRWKWKVITWAAVNIHSDWSLAISKKNLSIKHSQRFR